MGHQKAKETSVIERVDGDAVAAEALTAHLLDWYLDWAGKEQVARGRFTVESLVGAHTQVRQNIADEWPAMLGPGGLLLVDRQGDTVAGMVGLKPVSDGTGEVKRMIVDPAYRGRGIARALIEELMARAEGYRTLRLETADFMTEAQALYRAVGFVDVGMFDGGEADKIGLAASMRFMELELT